MPAILLAPLSRIQCLLYLTGPRCTFQPRCSTEARCRVWPAEVSPQGQWQAAGLPVSSLRQWVAAACPLLLQRPPQGYDITVFHSMHAEVENYQVHHWTVSRQPQQGALQLHSGLLMHHCTVSMQLQHGALQPYSGFSPAINRRQVEQPSQVVLSDLVELLQQPSQLHQSKAGDSLVCCKPERACLLMASCRSCGL